jgi:LemA protein
MNFKKIIGFGIAAAIILVVAMHINSVPKLDEEVKSAWAQVDNQYKRRYDLIPNLVNTVKGYAEHEQETLLSVVEARAKVGQINLNAENLSNPQLFAAFNEAQGELSSALSKLMVVVEKYPDLKANENFLALQSQLEGTENRIAVARKDYIQSVKNYNVELRTLPGKIVAAIFHPEATVKETFTATAQEQETPKVKF